LTLIQHKQIYLQVQRAF